MHIFSGQIIFLGYANTKDTYRILFSWVKRDPAARKSKADRGYCIPQDKHRNTYCSDILPTPVRRIGFKITGKNKVTGEARHIIECTVHISITFTKKPKMSVFARATHCKQRTQGRTRLPVKTPVTNISLPASKWATNGSQLCENTTRKQAVTRNMSTHQIFSLSI